MASKENEIPLIMESDTLPALKLWIMRKERCQQACNRVTKPCVEVIKDYFGPVACHTTMVLSRKNRMLAKGFYKHYSTGLFQQYFNTTIL